MEPIPHSSLQILQLSAALPRAAGDGSAATFATVRAQCQAGHRITYAFPDINWHPDQAFENELLAACAGQLRLFPLSGSTTWWDRLLRRSARAFLSARLVRAGLLTRFPQLLRERNSILARLICTMQEAPRPMRRALAKLLQQETYDLLQVDFPWMVRFPFGLSNLPRVFVVYEIQTAIAEQLVPSDRRLIAMMFQEERAALKQYDAVIAFSPEDEDRLRKDFGLTHVYYSPLAVNCSRCLPPVERMADSSVIRFTFLGGYDHPPNVDAVRWLHDAIFPRLKAALPTARMEIVGRYPPGFVQAFARPDFVFHGFVDDLSATLAGSVFLCPIRTAGGMRIKILDALLCGAPVISTRLGATCLGLEPFRHFWPAETADEFSAQVVRVLQDDASRRLAVTAAQERLVATFSPEAVAVRRTEVYQEILARRHASVRQSRVAPSRPVPRVAAVVLNYRSTDATIECVRHLQRVDYPELAVVVVDNDSGDDSATRLRKALPEVTILDAGRNLGYGDGNNVGIRWAMAGAADLVWVVSPDTHVLANALWPMIDLIISQPRIGVCGSIVHAGDLCIWASKISPRRGYFAEHRVCRSEELQRLGLPAQIDSGYVDGCAILLRTEMLRQIGLFRDDFFLYYDEAELCLRARTARWQVVIATGSHVHTRPITEERNDRAFYMVRNSILLARLHKRYLTTTLTRHLVTAIINRLTFGRLFDRVRWKDLRSGILSGLRQPINRQPKDFPV